MGVVPQEDNLDEDDHGPRQPPDPRALPRHEAEARPVPKALELLDFMELDATSRDTEIRELSGGMKRRLMIARGAAELP